MTYVNLDIETTGLDYINDKIVCIAFSIGGVDELIDCQITPTEEIIKKLEALKDYVIIAHNAKFDLRFIYTKYGVLFKKVYCTMLGSQILFNGKKFSHSLLNNLDYFLSLKLDSTHKKAMQQSFMRHEYGVALSQAQIDYVLSDIKYLEKLMIKQLEMINSYSLKFVSDLENRLLPVLVDMETRGCLIDIISWKIQVRKWERDQYKTELELDAIIKNLSIEYPQLKGGIYTRDRRKEKIEQTSLFGDSKFVTNNNEGNLNYASPKQILDLFDKLRLEPPTDKHGAISTGENSLATYLIEREDNPLKEFISKLLKCREYAKLISTYGDKFLGGLDENNYVHTEYTQCRTATGRLSSTNPNLELRVLIS